MSQENVEMVRMSHVVERIYGVFNDRDLQQGVTELCDPELEMQLSDAWFDAPRTYRGYQGILDFARDITDIFESFNVRVESLHAGPREVVAITSSGGIGRVSRTPVTARFGHLWRFKGGRAVFLKEFKRPEEALREAAGLSE